MHLSLRWIACHLPSVFCVGHILDLSSEALQVYKNFRGHTPRHIHALGEAYSENGMDGSLEYCEISHEQQDPINWEIR
jgi:hypothetical protein